MPATFPEPGPVGPVGPAETPFVFTQSTPSSDITIVHGLDHPLVTVHAYDSDGDEVEVGVHVIDDNTVQVTTEPGLPFSGKVLVI